MATEKPLDEMTEDELVEFYQAHKDDMSLWQTKAIELPPGPVSHYFKLDVTAADIMAFQGAAEAAGVGINEFIRSAALAEAERVSAGPGRREELRAALELIRGALKLEESRPASGRKARARRGA
jgi:hypothetical protein